MHTPSSRLKSSIQHTHTLHRFSVYTHTPSYTPHPSFTASHTHSSSCCFLYILCTTHTQTHTHASILVCTLPYTRLILTALSIFFAPHTHAYTHAKILVCTLPHTHNLLLLHFLTPICLPYPFQHPTLQCACVYLQEGRSCWPHTHTHP